MIATKTRPARPAESRLPAPTVSPTPTVTTSTATTTSDELSAIAEAERVLLDTGEMNRWREIAEDAKSLEAQEPSAEWRETLLSLASKVADGRKLHLESEKAAWPFRRFKTAGTLTPRLAELRLQIEAQVSTLAANFLTGDAAGRVQRCLMRCVPAGLLAHFAKLKAIARVGESAGFGCDTAVAETRQRLAQWAARKVAALEPRLTSATWRELVETPLAIDLADLEL